MAQCGRLWCAPGRDFSQSTVSKTLSHRDTSRRAGNKPELANSRNVILPSRCAMGKGANQSLAVVTRDLWMIRTVCRPDHRCYVWTCSSERRHILLYPVIACCVYCTWWSRTTLDASLTQYKSDFILSLFSPPQSPFKQPSTEIPKSTMLYLDLALGVHSAMGDISDFEIIFHCRKVIWLQTSEYERWCTHPQLSRLRSCYFILNAVLLLLVFFVSLDAKSQSNMDLNTMIDWNISKANNVESPFEISCSKH